MRAVGADREIGLDRAPIGETDHGRVGLHVERLGARVDPGEIGLEVQRGVERALHDRRLGNPRKLRNRGLVCREVQLRCGVAEHAHVVDRREARGVDRLPDPQPLEQRLRAAREGVDAGIEHGARGQRRAWLREQRHAQAALGQRQGRRLADEAATDHGDVKGLVACCHARIIAVGGGLTGPDGQPLRCSKMVWLAAATRGRRDVTSRCGDARVKPRVKPPPGQGYNYGFRDPRHPSTCRLRRPPAASAFARRPDPGASRAASRTSPP
jgi:hypothetical protein